MTSEAASEKRATVQILATSPGAQDPPTEELHCAMTHVPPTGRLSDTCPVRIIVCGIPDFRTESSPAYLKSRKPGEVNLVAI